MPLPREWIGMALVFAALARAALLVAHEPLVGYGNQYDMVRTSACLGLAPAIDEARRFAATPEAPIARYVRAAAPPGTCHPSTESFIDATTLAAAHALGADRGDIPLRWFGYAKLGLFALAALVIALALHREPGAALAHGAIVFLVLADPAVTLWLNTLYTEFAALWGLYAAIGAICALALSPRGGFALTALLALALVALAFSREQMALLGPALVLAAGPWLWARSPHAAVATFGVALVASAIAFGLMPRPADVAAPNRVDTYLGVVAPASADPARALATLGLPARCEPMIGASWYLRRGEDLDASCPEAKALSSAAFLRLAPREPQTLARAVARVLPATQAIVPDYLGVLAGERHARVEQLAPWLRSPLAAVHERMPAIAYAIFVLAVLVAAPLCVLAAAVWARPARGVPGVGFLLAILLGGTALYALVTTVFGDGFSEAARHFLPGQLALWSAWIAFALGVPGLIGRWARAPRDRAWEIAGAAVAAAGVVIACAAILDWARRQPLAYGVLDAPTSRQVAAGAGLALRGWALDPFGVESVELEAGALRRTLAQGPSPELARALPGYPDADRGAFALELTPADLQQAGAPAPVTLHVLVHGRTGVATEVERRRLEFRP